METDATCLFCHHVITFSLSACDAAQLRSGCAHCLHRSIVVGLAFFHEHLLSSLHITIQIKSCFDGLRVMSRPFAQIPLLLPWFADRPSSLILAFPQVPRKSFGDTVYRVGRPAGFSFSLARVSSQILCPSVCPLRSSISTSCFDDCLGPSPDLLVRQLDIQEELGSPSRSNPCPTCWRLPVVRRQNTPLALAWSNSLARASWRTRPAPVVVACGW
jgi:hypothetical protein